MIYSNPKPVKTKKKNKTKIWNDIRDKELIPQFQAWGITSCEIGLSVCKKTMFLGFAHTKKRREIKTPEDMRRVVLACQPCHELVEYNCKKFTRKTMTEFLEDIIKFREAKLLKYGNI